MTSTASSTAGLADAPLTRLPYITVQHDLQAVIQDVSDGTVSSESFWVSVYRQGSPSVHGRVQVKPSLEDENEVELEPQDGVSFKRVTGSTTSFHIACPALDVPETLVRFPKQTHRNLMPKGIDAMAISPNGQLYVTGGKDGSLQVGKTKDDAASSVVKLSGHVGDILSCRFLIVTSLLYGAPQFPSSEVVLSTSSDLSARVFSALDGSNPRTLTGHTAAVTDSAIIERGRHVMTSGNDGYVRLWSVGEGKNIKSWKVGKGSRKRVTKLALLDALVEGRAATATATTEALQQQPFEGKIVVAGLEDGCLAFINLASSQLDEQPRIEAPGAAPGRAVSALSLLTHANGAYLLAAGNVDGVISLYSGTISEGSSYRLPRVLHRFKRNDADITSLGMRASSSESTTQLLVGTSDGLPFQVEVAHTQNGRDSAAIIVVAELAGYNIDACNEVVEIEGDVYAAGSDGQLRRY